MRKLATIRKISDIQPIKDADKIELAIVDGWKAVVGKNQFKTGDTVIYCEIDSLLPIKDEFEFLRKTSYRKTEFQEGFRLKTMVLRGQISQGLVLPVSVLKTDNYELGQEVTEQLEIVKYEPPIPSCLEGKIKGMFPSFLRQTDEERIQNLANSYEELKQDEYYYTEKLDGSSATFYLRDGDFGVCSRGLDLLEDERNTFWKVAHQLNIESKLRGLGKNIAIQGELIGEGIEGNSYKLKGHTVRFFNVFDIDNYQYYDYENFSNIISNFDLETVPIISDLSKLPETIDELLLMANGKSALNDNVNREGLVINSKDGRNSFKVISNSFLLKKE